MDQLPFSQASENNKGPILDLLRHYFSQPGLVLEIGSGTGQHGVHFAGSLPHLVWQPSDRPGYERLSQARIDASGLPNLRSPLVLDVLQRPWPLESADAVFSANTTHIMTWPAVEAMFAGVGRILAAGGYFLVYGPFNENGAYTSPGNARFDRYLRSEDPAMGIRDQEALAILAERNGLTFREAHPMPANNRLLVWKSR